jgi:cytochrome c-type biogenesis protein CcmH
MIMNNCWAKAQQILSFFVVVLAVSNLYAAAIINKSPREMEMLHNLRCLVCQNQDLADSHALIAQDLRIEVHKLIIEGKNDSEIITYMTERYGDFILFKPAFKMSTLVLWLGPLFFVLLGLWLAFK